MLLKHIRLSYLREHRPNDGDNQLYVISKRDKQLIAESKILRIYKYDQIHQTQENDQSEAEI
jgi:hypothetical protein